mgnify:CR=1 FL=1
MHMSASFFVKKRMTIATFADILVIVSKIFREIYEMKLKYTLNFI